MSANMSTILIFGGTGGTGEAFARRFHAQGKKVIITGRREARLRDLQAELPGLETYTMDNADLAALPDHAAALLARYPSIDTVWVNSGIQYQGSLTSPSKFSDAKIITELNTNLTAPIMLARHFVPHLLGLGRPATFMITSSGIAFVPQALFPVYTPTKAAVHAFLVALRHDVRDTNLAVIEIAPPYVKTDLDVENRLYHVMTPMELDDYTEQTFAILDQGGDIKEAAVGFAKMGADAWRGAFQPVLDHMQIVG